jgi:predicted dehydrogenase
VSILATKPRLGFLGVGWIGRARLDALVKADAAEVAAVADPALPDALDSLDELLEHDLDGVVIATPSALHAEQAVAALGSGLAVFCQKPLGRDAAEAQAVVDAARAADALLGVDLCYRHTEAARACREVVAGGEIGEVFAAELAFHNAYGPDKAWFYDPKLAGGGCVIDLGTHLVDLALWTLGRPGVADVRSHLLRHGGHEVEDYAVAQLELDTGAAVSIACSWNLPIGRDCAIEAAFYGSEGSVRLHNVGGSFYDLRAERCSGRSAETLVEPPDPWGGRAVCEWAGRLARGARFDEEAEEVVEVARVVDRIYGRAP